MTNVYAKAKPLTNVKGRVSYISSPKRQENLVAVYGVTDKKFWSDLAAHCQKAAAEAGHEKGFEGREWHGALPNIYAVLYKDREEELAKEISDLFKEITGTDNIIGLHWNKTMTNFHFHAVCSENPEINEVTYGAELTKNTYYDAQGKRSLKKDCVDPETKELLPGCELLLKGERKKTIKRFGSKINLRGDETTNQIKDALAEKFNRDLQTNEYQRFKDDGLHLKQQHIGKNLPEDKKAAVIEKNKLVAEWNKAVDTCLDLSKKMSAEDNLEARKLIKSYREEIKTHALTDKWLESIEKFKGYIENIILFVQRKLQERAAQKRKPSLDEQTGAAKRRSDESGSRSIRVRGTQSKDERER